MKFSVKWQLNQSVPLSSSQSIERILSDCKVFLVRVLAAEEFRLVNQFGEGFLVATLNGLLHPGSELLVIWSFAKAKLVKKRLGLLLLSSRLAASWQLLGKLLDLQFGSIFGFLNSIAIEHLHNTSSLWLLDEVIDWHCDCLPDLVRLNLSIKLLLNKEVILRKRLLGGDDVLAIVNLCDHMVIISSSEVHDVTTVRSCMTLTTFEAILVAWVMWRLLLMSIIPHKVAVFETRTLVFELLATLANMLNESVLFLVVLSLVSRLVDLAELASLKVLLCFFKLALELLLPVTFSVVVEVTLLAFPLTVLPVLRLVLVGGSLTAASVFRNIRIVVALVVPLFIFDREALLQWPTLFVVATVAPIVVVLIAVVLVFIAIVNTFIVVVGFVGPRLSKILLAILPSIFSPGFFFAKLLSSRITSLIWSKKVLFVVLNVIFLSRMVVVRLSAVLTCLFQLLSLVGRRLSVFKDLTTSTIFHVSVPLIRRHCSAVWLGALLVVKPVFLTLS